MKCINKEKNNLSEKGQTVLEYSLFIAFMMFIIIASVPSLRESVIGTFHQVIGYIDSSSINAGENSNSSDLSPPLTQFGSTVSEISGGMLNLVNNFYSENNRYPRSWGDYAYTDLGLDPAQWKDKEFGGVIYKPNGTLLRIQPGVGYAFQIKDENGNTQVLSHNLNWDLVYRIPNDNRWYYHSVDGPVVMIETLVVIQQ